MIKLMRCLIAWGRNDIYLAGLSSFLIKRKPICWIALDQLNSDTEINAINGSNLPPGDFL